MAEALRYAAVAMLQNCESVSLASIDEAGFPHIREMEKVLGERLEHIYFVTLKASNKVCHFQQNARAGVGFCIGDDCASLIGHVEILEDAGTIQGLLPAPYLERLCKKGFGRYCVLHFKTTEVKVFVESV